MYVDACINTENEINFLEHVQSKVSVKVKYRGMLMIRFLFKSLFFSKR
jgi:hypothetical protein